MQDLSFQCLGVLIWKMGASLVPPHRAALVNRTGMVKGAPRWVPTMEQFIALETSGI